MVRATEPQDSPREGQRLDASSADEVRRRWEAAVGPGARPESTLRAPVGGTLVAPIQPPRLDHAGTRPGDGWRLPRCLTTAGGQFVLETLLGEGGMGLVYRARQTSVDRQIAVKVIRPEFASQSDRREHFLSEAMVTGGLDHPNVVPIHDLGATPDGTVFYAMKEVRGTPWSEVIGRRSEEENLEILLRVADAVAFAHSKGIVHRDLKPGNVMLGDYGEVLVMDWGLALRIGPEGRPLGGSRTGAGGTPAYLAPEMALGATDHIGPACDIYLLGGILYEIVTGLRPHAGEGVMGCLTAAAGNQIQPTHRDDELVRIARRAMATDPAARYADVKAFQQAIREYRHHAESLILEARARERLERVQRNPSGDLYGEYGEVISGYRQALALWAGNVRAVKGLRQVREAFAECALQRGDLSLAQSQVRAIGDECGEFLLVDGGTAADRRLPGPQPPAAEATGPRGRAATSPQEPPSRLPEPTALATRVRAAAVRAARRERVARLSRTAAVTAGAITVAVSIAAAVVTRRQRDRAVQAEAASAAQHRRADAARDRADVALASLQREDYANVIALADRRIAAGEIAQAEDLLWNTPAERRHWEWGRCLYLCHQELLTLRGQTGAIGSLAFSPDGTRLLSADGVSVWLWDVSTDGGGRDLRGAGGARCVAFSPDGRLIATGHTDSSVVLWDAASGMKLRAFPGRKVPLGAIAFAPDNALIAVAEMDNEGDADGGETRVLEVATGRGVATFRGLRALARCVGFSPDGRRLVTVPGDAVHVWDTHNGREILTLAVRAVSAVFSPDGATLYVVGTRGLAGAWDAATGVQRATFVGHTDMVLAVAVSADGARVVTAGIDRTARAWDAATGKELLCIGTQVPAWSAALTPNGRLLATGGADGAVRLWDTARELSTVSIPGRPAGFSDGHARLVTVGHGAVTLWDARTGERLGELGARPDAVHAVLSADSRRLFASQGDGALAIWDLERGRRLTEMKGQAGPVRSLDLSPDGTRAASIAGEPPRRGDGNPVCVWDTATGERLVELTGHEATVWSVRFSADGRQVVTGSADGTARTWDAATGRELCVLRRAGTRTSPVMAAALSPDGCRVVAGYGAHPEAVAVLWDVASGQERAVLKGHSSRVISVAFSPDGRRVFTTARDQSLRVWDAESGRELLALQYPGSELLSLAAGTGDGRALALSRIGATTLVLNTLDWALRREDLGPMKRAAYQAWLRENGSAPALVPEPGQR